jgi:type II secretory pathway component GspD/PulD (secretin)
MRAFAVALALSTLFATAFADIYKVQHRRPSAILANLLMTGGVQKGRVLKVTGSNNLGLVPNGVTLTADDAASTISVDGPKERMEDVVRILQEFDVAPRQVTAHITVRSKADKYQSTTVTQVNNNAGWTLEDSATGVKFKLTPRINGDGTVTGAFDISDGQSSSKIVARLKLQEPLVFTIGSGIRARSSDGQTWEEQKGGEADHKTPGIEVIVTFEIAADPSEGKIDRASHAH